MEQLPLPRDPIRGHATIALASAQFADPGPFLTYAERYGDLLRGSHPHVPTQADALAGRFAAAVSSADVASYYQGWLFFALLAELLGPDLYRADRYLDVTMGEDGEIELVALSTRYLHEDLAAWRERGALRRVVRGDAYHAHVAACLDAAAGAFDDLEATFPGFLAVAADDMLCVAALGETLDSFVETALERGPLPDDGPPAPSLTIAQASRSWLQKVSSLLVLDGDAAMLAAGWCPSDVRRVADFFNTIAAYYYFSHFSHFKADAAHGNAHAACPAWGCTLSPPSSSPPQQPQHVAPDCACPGMISFSEESLISIYEEGHIPCFSIGRLEGGGLGVALSSIPLDGDPAHRYVALSHVWAEGLGNAAANALPFCQVADVQYWAMLAQQSVDGAAARVHDPFARGIVQASSQGTQQVHLWIDTLCCPATPGYGKNLCLARMRDIYAHAHAVLVRSATLKGFALAPYITDPRRGVMDPAAALFLSPWIRRMWTLQEGVLAGLAHDVRGVGERLLLGYGDALLSLESVVALLKQAPTHEVALAFDMLGRFSQLSPAMYSLEDRDSDSDGGGAFFLHVLTTALKFRSVSVAADEVVCLATLLGLRVAGSRGAVPLIGAGQTPQDGMCELWRRVEAHGRGIPADIVFSTVPRVAVAGFRWAPRTLIQTGKYGPLYPVGRAARITPRGLEVRFRGVRLSCASPEIFGRRLLSSAEGEKPEAAEEDFTRVMIVQVPSSDGDPETARWFALRIRRIGEYRDAAGATKLDEADDNTDRRDPYALLKAGKLALILRHAGFVEDDDEIGQGLLVSVVDGDDAAAAVPSQGQSEGNTNENKNTSSGLQARTEYPVSITPLLSGASQIAASCMACLERLQVAVNSEAAEWTDGDAVERLLRQAARDTVAASEALSAALFAEALSGEASTTAERVLDTFVRHVNRTARFGGVVGTVTGEDQLWWVD
ncbi:hypothetical protein B0T24DRAFT_300997 [Lasiosphaeria ovina]|uniref:Heterokaryon incompatibility domain-containing protein n=1 Tax=Lasiosphaeria ovina TaxID=92902 RepID=A0AAE0K6M1_9PEZI|nr:hypothetical protein B0T24DRAFT_300997 [Lasiosphaeria ovina]